MKTRIAIGWVAVSAALVAGAFAASCSGGGGHVQLPPSVVVPFQLYFQPLASGDAQFAALCARGNQDAFAQWYCGTHPTITSLDDLLVGLNLKDPANPFGMSFAMTGHSESIVGRFTTSLNPRVIVFSPLIPSSNEVPTGGGGPFPTGVGGAGNFVAVGYARGNELAEIAAFDPAKQDINFYLLRYSQSCDPSCSNADLFTPSTESNWTGVTVYGDVDLQDTPLDCLQCHEPGGKGAERILRMQERTFPWTHWFGAFAEDGGPGGGGVTNAPNGGGESIDLTNEFQAAHDGEEYGGVPASAVFGSAPFNLESLVEIAGYAPQPNEFDSAAIQGLGRSAQWLALYDTAVAGQAISPPFYDVDPFDKSYVKEATRRYVDVMKHGADPAFVPDMSAIFPDSELGDLGFRATDSATTGITVVQHRCGTCHDGRFPGISRANFDWHDFPNNLPAGERDKILMRIRLGDDNVYKMPPTLFSNLTEKQIELIEQTLGK